MEMESKHMVRSAHGLACGVAQGHGDGVQTHDMVGSAHGLACAVAQGETRQVRQGTFDCTTNGSGDSKIHQN